MLKFFLTVLLVLSTVAVVVHEMLVYQMATTELTIVEEESPDNKTGGKEAKDMSKEWLGYRFELYHCAASRNPSHFGTHPSYACCKGFYNKPYNPPDVI